MKSVCKIAMPAFFAAATLMSAGTEAALTTYSDRGSFEAQGTIAEKYGFEDWDTSGATFGDVAFPPNPYTAHGVTYTSAQYVIVGPASRFENSSNVIINDSWSPISGELSDPYDMLGFDLGILGEDSLIDFSITTSQSTYSFLNVLVPNVNAGMTFFGFIAGGGETISQMTFSSQVGLGAAPALDNVTLGNTAPIPEPETYVMLMAGLGLLGLMGRRKKRLPAACATKPGNRTAPAYK